MKTAIVFGATTSAKCIITEIEQDYCISWFCDNDSKKWGTVLDGKEIISPNEIKSKEFDVIIIISLSALYAIKKQLIAMGIDEGRIITNFVETKVNGRIEFVKCFAKLLRFKNGLTTNGGGGDCRSRCFPGRVCCDTE